MIKLSRSLKLFDKVIKHFDLILSINPPITNTKQSKDLNILLFVEYINRLGINHFIGQMLYQAISNKVVHNELIVSQQLFYQVEMGWLVLLYYVR